MSGKKVVDETPIEYVASMSEDRKVFSLVISCDSSLSDEEFAASLVAFAQDIFDGEFSFDNDAEETLSQ